MIIRKIAIVATSLSLTACYFPNQARFERHVHQRVVVGMRYDDAVAALTKDRIKCGGTRDPHRFDCNRFRESLSPFTCVERLYLDVAENSGLVESIDIPEIGCAGL